jgi:hypothetical protein
MNSFGHALLPLSLLAGLSAHAQFNASDVQYWIGAGPDSTILVVDFQDGTSDASYAWGYLHDGGTAADMLTAISAADVDLTAEITSGFLNTVTYGNHVGVGGSPNYWSTWSGSSLATLTSDGGIAASLGNGDWYGCSYTDFNPALAPTEPVAAFDPLRFTVDDVAYWVGSGPDSTVLVIDFQDGSGTSSFAWGYLHEDGATAAIMLNDIAASDPALSATITGGLLMDMTYGTHVGLGGNPDDWATWSGTNLGNWHLCTGVDTILGNGDLFGCSYTDHDPPLRPGYPVAAEYLTGIAAHAAAPSFQAWPSPATDMLHVTTSATGRQVVTATSLTGQRVYQGNLHGGAGTVDVNAWAPGLYLLQVGAAKRVIAVH